MMGYGIGRIGCQLSGDGDWGVPNNSPMPDWLSFLPEWMWKFDYFGNVNGVDLGAPGRPVEIIEKEWYSSMKEMLGQLHFMKPLWPSFYLEFFGLCENEFMRLACSFPFI